MKLSQRAIAFPSSPIRKLAPYADAAKRSGVHVYHLNIGQPDIKTPECALQAMRNYPGNVLEYSPSDGFLSLRRKLVSYYGRFGIELNDNEIIVTTGGSEAVLLAFLTCINPGDELIVPEPFYANYRSFAIAAGAEVRPVATRIEDGFRLPSVEAIEEQITPRSRAILICNPNNPTGYVYTKEEMLRLRDIVRRHDLFLFCDEVYREFTYTGEPFFSALQLEGVEDNVVVIDSVSKRYSECGVRIGCICSRNKDLMAAVMKFCQARLSPPLIGQIIAEASIDVPQSYLKGVYDEYLERRNFFIEGLRAIPGVFTPLPMGAFYTVARLPVDDSEKFCKWCLTDFRYDGATVMMAPASGFYSDSSCGRNEVRIAYVLNKEDLAKALVCLRKALEEYPGRTQA
ncbi:MAG: pyridoxal phosphate-dependent aminotransferase [Bacteroidales bacterium]|nr:pyridoxal phosphate-dependent aminotransferase [Bacteroidales bacterium]